MFGFSRKQISISNSTILDIEKDVYDFVVQELSTYKQNPDNNRLDNSVIVNLALFDLSALNYDKGYTQMCNLLSDHSNQMVGRRMKQLLLTLYIRYTKDVVNTLSVITLDGIADVFDVGKSVLAELDNTYNTFWLQPFIRKAYDEIMYGLENTNKSQNQ